MPIASVWSLAILGLRSGDYDAPWPPPGCDDRFKEKRGRDGIDRIEGREVRQIVLIRRQMQNRIDAVERRDDCLAVGDRADDAFHAWRKIRSRVRNVHGRSQRIEDAHAVASRDERRRDVFAQEPGPACDKDPVRHGTMIPAKLRGPQGGGRVSQNSVQPFLRAEQEFEHRTGTAHRAIEWQFATSGDTALESRLREMNHRVREHFADRQRFDHLSRWRSDGAGLDPLARRQVDLYWRDYLGAQEEPEIRERIITVQTEQQGLFNRFRASLDGRDWSENDLSDALASETDDRRARDIWEAAKQIGGLAADRARELVRLLGQSARALGFRDAYALGLAQSEVDEAMLFALLDELDRASEAPYRAAKEEMDAELARRFGISSAALRPWHYGDPFFQRPPRAQGPDLDPHFANLNPEDLAIATVDAIGLDARGILSRSDNWPRPGKNQHAFCTWIDADASDVRTLNNLTRSHHWTSVLLHEFGHALAAEYADRSLPLRLILWPNGIVAEMESQSIDRIANDAGWLHRTVGLAEDISRRLAGEVRARARRAQLIMTRWSLVQAHFERAFHADPDADLDTLWWDLVERFQFVPRPEGRRAPDWSAKIHNAQIPGTYYQYILGEMAVSQMAVTLDREVGGLAGNPSAGPFLRDRLYRLGARYDWRETIRRATGQEFGASAYVAEWFSNKSTS